MTLDQSKPVRKLVVIGLGLIGGSLAASSRARGLCQEVIGVVRSEDIGVRALELGVADSYVTNFESIASTLEQGDVVFIAVPTLSVRDVLTQVQACTSPEVTITDGASVKGSVLKDVLAVYGCVPPQVVLGHPIAGSEKSGVEASDPNLYVNHRVILTPTEETMLEHIQRVTYLWSGAGAEVVHLSVAEHDEILASTSHLPHAIAFSLVDTLAHDNKNEQIFKYAAGGFRDFTRIASSDAVMWRDIMLANHEAVVEAIDLFVANVTRLRQAVHEQDGEVLLKTFERAKEARDHFSKMLAKRMGISIEE
jgi:prephenate dehydrogenase